MGKNNSVICVYDISDNERLIAQFDNSKDCAKYFNTSSACINCDVSRKVLKKLGTSKNIYLLVRVNLGKEE